MKNLKSILLAGFLTVGAFSSAVFTSCNPDACKDVVCQNGGNCTDGTCTCPAGYEGTLCETMARTKFVKNWTAADIEAGTSTVIPYSCVITAGAGVTNLVIASTFADDFFVNSITATASGNTITIASQEPDSDNYWVEGTGTMSGTTLSWNYKLINKTVTPNQTLNYTGTWN